MRGDSLFRMVRDVDQNQTFGVKEKIVRPGEITSLYHKRNTNRKFIDSPQNTRVFDKKWRPNRFLDESRTNVGRDSRIHRNDNSNCFSRRRYRAKRDQEISLSNKRQENSLPAINQLRIRNQYPRDNSKVLRDRNRGKQRNARSYDIYAFKYKEFMDKKHLYSPSNYTLSHHDKKLQNQNHHQKRTHKPLFKQESLEDIDPLNPNLRLAQPTSFFKKYKAKLEKNHQEKILKNKMMPSILENKFNNSTNRLINNIIQSRKDSFNVSLASKPKKIYPDLFNSDQKERAKKYLKKLITGSENLSSKKIDILTRLIINGLNISKKISKFDLKYTPKYIQLKTPNPSKLFSLICEFC